MKGVEILTTSNIVASISSIIGPLGSVLGIVGGIMKILKKEPNIEHLFAEQTALITESFNAMSDQVIFELAFNV